MNKIALKVLENGFVRYIKHMGEDLHVVQEARRSYDQSWKAGDDKGSDVRLIKYLMRNGHTSPFETCAVTFDVKAPIFVARQWMRHRTQSFNEVSARYTELPEELYVPELEHITEQSKDNKQMRTEVQSKNSQIIQSLIQIHGESAFQTYRGLLSIGCPRELARSVLPTNTFTNFSATANLHNWYKFCAERCHEHAQYEIRVYADAIVEMLEELFPVSTAAWKEYVKK